MTDEAYRQLTGILRYLGFENLSKDIITRRAMKLSGLQVQLRECCPRGCISYDDPQVSASNPIHCPNPKCCAPRYKTIKKRRRYGDGYEQIKKPSGTYEYYPVEPYIDALLANPKTCKAVVDSYRSSMSAAQAPDAAVSDISQGAIMVHLRQQYLSSAYDIPLSFSSDAADIQTKHNRGENVKAHIAVFNVLSLPPQLRFKHSSVWRCWIIPKPHDLKSYVYTVERELLQLEAGKKRYISVLSKEMEQITSCALVQADTVEQTALAGTVGASGKKICFDCEYEGIREGINYHHPFHTPNGSLRPDIALPSATYRTGDFTYPFRTYAGLMATLSQLNDPRTSRSFKKQVQLNSGITSHPAFLKTMGFQLTYPHFMARDSMHGLYSVLLKDTMLLTMKKTPSLLSLDSTPSDFWDKLEALQLRSRPLRPSCMGQRVRSVKKFSDWKAAELRTFITQDFLIFADDLRISPKTASRNLYELIRLMTIMARALESPHTFSLQSAADIDMVALREDGKVAVSKKQLQTCVGNFLRTRENLFYGRQPAYLTGICTPTHHRVSHMPEDRAQWGPGSDYAQWQLEGIIGDDTRKARSRSQVIANMRNNAKKQNILKLIELRFDNVPDTSTPANPPRASHELIPDTYLLHPKRSVKKFPAAYGYLFREWMIEKAIPHGDIDEIIKWARCELSTGTVVRSAWVEGSFDEGRSSEDQRYASRFVKFSTSAHSTQVAEIDSFWEIRLRYRQGNILTALVQEYKVETHPSRVYQTANSNAGRCWRLIGVEQIRQVVDVKFMPTIPHHPQRIAFTTKASGDATPWLSIHLAYP